MTHIIYPGTNFKKVESMCINKSKGIYIYDDSGKKYIEAVAGLWCVGLGFGNEEIAEVAAKQIEINSFSHMFSSTTHDVGMKLADKIQQMVPMTNPKVFFGFSGSDANDTILRIIQYHAHATKNPDKRKIIARERAYHGVTYATSALTDLPSTRNFFNPPTSELGVLRTDHPHYMRGKILGESENGFVNRIIENLEQLIIREGPETISTFIAEPIVGAGGVIVPPPGYYQKLQSVLKKYDIKFWADEVICGFGRTGSDFGSTTVNIQNPEIMTFAKQLSSGYVPMSAAVINGDMYESLIEQSDKSGTFGHGFTYTGHPLACAITLKTLEIYERENIYENARKTGEYLFSKLDSFKKKNIVGEIRGSGLLAAIELVRCSESLEPFKDNNVGKFVYEECKRKGLIVRSLANNTIVLCPPMIITNTQIDEIISILEEVLDLTEVHIFKSQ